MRTRHNIGWQILDTYAGVHEASFAAKSKFFAEIAELTDGEEKVLLVKPQTFYNETGQSLRTLVDFYKLTPASDVLVIHDDLALPFGTLRTRGKGSDAGNNGIKSLNAHIGPDYTRLRAGVYSDSRAQMGDVDFVLGRFTSDEQTALSATIIPKACELINEFITGELAHTSHKL